MGQHGNVGADPLLLPRIRFKQRLGRGRVRHEQQYSPRSAREGTCTPRPAVQPALHTAHTAPKLHHHLSHDRYNHNHSSVIKCNSTAQCTVDTVRTVIIYSLHVFYWLLFLKPRVSKTHSTLLNPATTFDCIVTSICLLPTDFCLLTCSRRLTCARAKRAVLCQALYGCTGRKFLPVLF